MGRAEACLAFPLRSAAGTALLCIEPPPLAARAAPESHGSVIEYESAVESAEVGFSFGLFLFGGSWSSHQINPLNDNSVTAYP